MTGDPDWGEIVDRSIQIRAAALNAASIVSAPLDELGEALASIITEEVEQLARMEIMIYRMSKDDPAGWPGVSHGVGLAARRVALLIELQRRLKAREFEVTPANVAGSPLLHHLD